MKKTKEKIKVGSGKFITYILALIANGYLIVWAYHNFYLNSPLGEEFTIFTGLAFIMEIIFSFYIFANLMDTEEDYYNGGNYNNNNNNDNRYYGGWGNNRNV